MEIQVFGLIVLVLGVLSLNVGSHWAIYILAACCLFACTATIAFPALGGLTILPANLFLMFFLLRAFNIGGAAGLWRPMAPGSAGFPLLCLCVFALVGAMFLPRALAGATYVYAINRGAVDPNTPGMQPLGPVSGNLTQSVYFIGEVVVYSCMTVFLARRNGFRHFAQAMLVLAGLNVVAAIVDLGSAAVGLNVLRVIKTASYVMHDGDEVGGLRRIVGTFAEASAFSYFTLPLFAFTANLWLFRYRPRITGFLMLASGVLLALSTSTTAYVGFAAYLLVLLAGRCSRIAPRSGSRKRSLFVIVACLGIIALLYGIVFKPAAVESIADFFNDTVVSKADSASGVERGSWNRQAFVNFFQTFGLGIGIGSARTSSFLLVLLSNLGILGTTFFGAFVWNCVATPIATRAPMIDRVVCYASRQAMLAVLVTASISGTVFDLGPCFYMFAAAAGMLSAAPRRVPARQRVSPPAGEAPPRVLPVPPMSGTAQRASRVPAWPSRIGAAAPDSSFEREAS